MIDPFVWCAVAALAAAAVAVAPVPAALGVIGVALVLRRKTRPAVLGVCGLLLVVQGARSFHALERAREAHARALVVFSPPAICAGRGTIVQSPVATLKEGERDDGKGGGHHGTPDSGSHADNDGNHPGNDGNHPGNDGNHAGNDTGHSSNVVPSATGAPNAPSPTLSTRASVRIHSGDCDGRPLPAGMVVRLYDLPDDLRRDDEIDFIAKLLPVHLFEQAELPSPWPAIARSEIIASGAAEDVLVVARPLSLSGAVDGARTYVRRRILATYTPDAAKLARALVIGETDLAEDEIQAFRDSGLLHLLAVSGTHLVLVVAALSGALRRVLLHIEPLAARIDVGRAAAAFGIVVAWLYADFAGGGGSAVRAAAMITVALLAKALGHRPAGGRSLAVGLLVTALCDPLIGLDVSFGLSAGATTGLVLLGNPFIEKLTGLVPAAKAGARSGAVATALRKLAGGVLASIATTLAATIGSMPAMLRFSPRLPLLGVLANVIAAPFGELVALPVCLAHAIASLLPPVERLLALVGSGSLLVVRGIARVSASLGGGLDVPPPTPVQLATAAIAAAALAVAPDRRQRLAVLAAAAAALLGLDVLQVHLGAPRGVLRVTALDVGQGDSILIDLPDGSTMLIDGGGMVGNPVDPGTRVILPVLAARRRTRLDVLVLSHPHPDHFTGLATVAQQFPFGELWDTGHGEAHGVRGAYGELLGAARSRGKPLRRPAELCGKPRAFGAATVEVLWPCPRANPALSANDTSFVIRIDFGKRSALLVGDAEIEAEHAVLASGVRVKADLLKVGHHGSRTSSSAAFLQAVAPEAAMISCGVRNRFGHPHPFALDRLATAGVAVVRTDRGGEIIWQTDGESVRFFRP